MIVPDRGRGVDTPMPPEREHAALTPAHRHELEVGSAIPADVIDEEGARSVASAADLPMPSVELIHYNPEKALRFGQQPRVSGPGMLLPMENPQGHVSYQFKPDHPRLNDDGKPVKYETPPGTRNVVHVPRRVRRLLNKRGVPLWITEGWKKTMSGAGAGLCIVGLSGVWNWRVRADAESSLPLPDFDFITLIGRIVVIAFDSDARNNPKVMQAQRELRRFLEGRGATVLIVEIPEGPDGAKWGLDDFLAAGGSTDDLLTDAQIAAISGPTPDGHVAGSDGAETCRECADKDATISALREEVAEYRAADELVRRGPVPAAEALALAHLVNVSANARTRGEDVVPLYVPADAKSAGVGDNTMKRAIGQVRRWQDDPEAAAALPFKIEDEWRDGKLHLRLRSLPLLDQDGPGSAKATMTLTVARLPRDPGRAKHGGVRDACPKCESPMLRTVQDRCTNDQCNHVIVHPSRIVGSPPLDQDGPVETVTMYGDTFMTEVRAAPAPLLDQDGPYGDTSYRDQDGPVVPAAFVSRDDLEAAAGRHLWAVPRVDEPRCVRSGCLNPADNGFICAYHLAEAPPILAVAGGAE